MKKTLTGLLALLASCTLFSACFTGTAGNSTSQSSPSSSVNTSTPEETTSESTSENPTVDPHEEALALAKNFVYGDLIEKDVEVSKDYTLLGSTYSFVLEEELTVSWTVDVTEGVVLSYDEATKLWKVDVDEFAEEDILYTLTGTIADSDGHTASFTLDRKVLKAADVVPEKITEAPVEGEAYKLYMYQEQKKNDLYFTGKMSGFYLGTNNASKGEGYEVSTDVFVEKVAGKDAYYLTFTDADGAKQYIGITNTYNNNKFHVNAIVRSSVDTTLDAGEVVKTFEYTWNTDLKTLVVTLEGVKSGSDQATTETKTESYFLGTSGSYYTFGAMAVSEAEGAYVGYLVKMVNKSEVSAEDKVASEKATLNVTTAFSGAVSEKLPTQGTTYGDVTIAWAVKSGDASLTDNVLNVANPTAETTIVLTATFTCGEVTDTKDVTITVYPKSPVTQVTDLQEGVAYTVYMYHTTNAKNYYFTGKMDGKYLATTDDITKAADVYIENVEGGFKVYVMEGEAKSYIALEAYQAEGKSYISANVSMNATGSVFTYNSQFLTLCCKAALADNSKSDVFFLGTYGTYTTMSASGSYYMTADKLGTEQFYATFGLIDESALPPEGGEGGGDIIVPGVTTSTVASVLAAENGEYQVEGTVLAVTAKSFVLKDSTGSILVYLNTAPSVKAGDKVIVKGTTSVYANGKQFGQDSVVTFVEAGSVGMQIATSLDAAKVNEYAAVTSVTIKYVEVTGILDNANADKPYVAVDGANATIRISYPNAATKAVLAELNGEEISVEGYFIGVNTSSGVTYVHIVAVNVKATDAGIGDDKDDKEDEECKHNYEDGVCTECGEADPDYKPEGGDEKPVVPEDAITTSVKVVDYAATNSWVNDTNYSDLYLDDYVTASVEGTAVGTYALSTGKYYTNGNNWRIYQSESSTLTIWVEKGLTIHSVKITYTVKNTGILILDGEQIASDVVVEGIEDSFVTFSVSATDSSKTNGQVQITAIEVVYSGVEAEEKPGEGEDEKDCEHNYVEGVCTECGEADPNYVAPGEGGDKEDEKPVDQIAVLEAAYALAKDETLANQTLTGVIVKIDSAYSTQHGNITVTILVEEMTDMPMLCYRIKGEGADTIKVGDTITVTGTIKNYSGTIEFDAGSALTAVDTEAPVSEITKIYTEAIALEVPNAVKEAGDVVLATTGETYADVAISWAADNDCVAVNGGVLTFTLPQVAATVTLTATVVCGESSEAYTFAVTVSAAPSADTLTAGFVSSQLGLANAADFTTKTVDQITFTAAKNDGSNAPKYYTTGTALRLYGKNSFTISCAAGYKIVSIAITTETGSNGISANNCTLTNATATGLGSTSVLLTPVDGTAAVVMTNPNSSGQFRIAEISVTYAPVAPTSDER